MNYCNEVKKHGSLRAAARANDMSPTTFRRRMIKERQDALTAKTLFNTVEHAVGDKVRHFVITSAQDRTRIHEDFWKNLQVYADYLDADLLVGAFTYSMRLFQDPSTMSAEVWYDDKLEPFMVYDRIALGENLLFCAEMNTLPTADRPLSALDAYTGRKWGIFPHAKIQLDAIPTLKSANPKQILTTGAVTLPNYIKRKAGMKAEFHHQIGALIVSVAPDGAHFCRHVQATSLEDGSFYDLDYYISNGEITDGHRPEVLVLGDIHIEKSDPQVIRETFGYITDQRIRIEHAGALSNRLRPKNRIFHDIIDFSARNHHNIGDHHHRMKLYHRGGDSVRDDVHQVRDFLDGIQEPDIQDHVIQSNHDNALEKWLKADGVKYDAENYEFWLERELDYVKHLIRGTGKYNHLQQALIAEGLQSSAIFVEEDSGFEILDVELSIHGHHGANGGRGSPNTYAKLGIKTITAHAHSPCIRDGHMRVGTNSKRDMGYNKGLSSWAPTDALIYKNGKRVLLTFMNGRWFD